MRLSFITASLVSVIMSASAVSVVAATIAYTEGGTANPLAAYGASGFQFGTTKTIEVTDLGFDALSIGGGDVPHVMLWDVTTSTKLADINTGAPLTTGWHYFTVGTPITLTPAHTYQVAADIYWVPTYGSTGGFSFGPEITSPTFVKSSGGWSGWTGYDSAPLSTPDSAVATGANLIYNVVPEPTALALLPLLGLGMMRRRKA